MKATELPIEFYPYDYKNTDDVLNVLSWQVGDAHKKDLFHGYDDIDTSFMAFLIEHEIPEDRIHESFQLIFNSAYDERKTQTMFDRVKTKLDSGETIRGTGTFIHRLKEMNLKEIENFSRQLQRAAGKNKPPSQFHGTYSTREAVKLKVSTLQDILSYEDPTYLIDRVLIENTLTLLSGYAGAYKSLLSEFMAFSILTGQKLFGHFNVFRKGGVLIVDEENPGAFLKERLEMIGFTNNLPISFLHFQRVKVDDPNCFAELIQVIKDIKPTLVVFDALIRIHNRKENETEMALVMERLRDIVNLGVTVLLIHHHRKGAGDKRESVRGSSDILAGVDVHFSIEEKENYIVLSSPKSRTKPLDSIRLKLEATDDLLVFRYIGAELNENQIIVNEIVEILQGGIKIGVKEILEELKNKDYEIGQNRLREILQGATGKELIEITVDRGKKLYSLNSTFTASRVLYRGVNCEAEKDQVNDLHSFTEAPPLNCETEKQEVIELEHEGVEIIE
jgi:hypothetical protein